MKSVFKKLSYLVLLIIMMGLVACEDNAAVVSKQTVVSQALEPFKLDVYKSPTCECCGRWVSHIGNNGIDAATHHPADLNLVKNQLGIRPQYQSCHTGVSKEGYIFEGHIPADVMQRFMKEKPEGVLGLAVPGMPIGSPGMEMGDRRDAYDVLLLNKDGSSTVYQQINAGV
ncbi:MAG: DUF411 domain-containing protein [Cycloclasticus sp.]|nr:DUF411 domain-containing protein [Cycloclasticus sp.]